MDTPSAIRIAEIRAKAAGRTVDELCRVAACSRASWQRWKRGRGEPTISQWRRVEAFLAELPPIPDLGAA